MRTALLRTGYGVDASRTRNVHAFQHTPQHASLADFNRGSNRCATSNRIPSLNVEEPLDLQNCRHFVNLTNGIEALPMLHDLQVPYSFVRIQSTACEQQNLEALMAELDANLLLSLALGHCCLVYDCGSRGRDGTPRALWYGLEFIRYTLSKLWLRQPCPALLRGRNVARTFDDRINAFRQSTKRRLQYYAKYLPGEVASGDEDTGGGRGGAADGADVAPQQPCLQRLRLYGVCRATDHDDDLDFFVGMLRRYEAPLRAGRGSQAGPREGRYAFALRSHVESAGGGVSAMVAPLQIGSGGRDTRPRVVTPLAPGSRSNGGRDAVQEARPEMQQSESSGLLEAATQSPARGDDDGLGMFFLHGTRAASEARDGGGSSSSTSSGDSGSSTSDSATTSCSSPPPSRISSCHISEGGHSTLPGRGTDRSTSACTSTSSSSLAASGGAFADGGPALRHKSSDGGSYGGESGDDDGSGDGEVVLGRYGFRLFRRGLSPVEWAARAQQAEPGASSA